jgi:hypothetical protein
MTPMLQYVPFYIAKMPFEVFSIDLLIFGSNQTIRILRDYIILTWRLLKFVKVLAGTLKMSLIAAIRGCLPFTLRLTGVL